MASPNGEYLVYVGTYTGEEDESVEGIYIYRMNPETGDLKSTGGVSGIVNPTFLALDPENRYLYAVNEVDDVEGDGGGAVSAYAIDAGTGALTFLNRQSSKGPGPCHLSVDATGRVVVAANYSGGSVVALPVQDGGRLGEATAFIQHEGSSVHSRQKEPHAHSIINSSATFKQQFCHNPAVFGIGEIF